MALVIVGYSLDITQSHRQERLTTLQRLNLALLVDREDKRFIGRIEIEPDDVADLFKLERIGRELEMLRSVRLYTKEREIALHGALADTGLLGDASNTPVSRVPGLFFEHGAEHLGDFILVVSAGSPGSGYIIEARETILIESIAPIADDREAYADCLCNVAMRGTPGREEDDPRTPNHSRGERSGAGDVLQFFSLIIGQHDVETGGASSRHGILQRENITMPICITY
ncbi:MAG: hypothetical protein Q7S20_13020 [Gemmatimonadaceae bacterium]|nr:hypothetical protein [Gemmatimonadaceae bacterium]